MDDGSRNARTLIQVRQNSDLGDINILGQNLDDIRKGYQPKNKG